MVVRFFASLGRGRSMLGVGGILDWHHACAVAKAEQTHRQGKTEEEYGPDDEHGDGHVLLHAKQLLDLRFGACGILVGRGGV